MQPASLVTKPYSLRFESSALESQQEATSLGLACLALDLPVSSDEANNGLVPVAAAQFVIGKVSFLWPAIWIADSLPCCRWFENRVAWAGKGLGFSVT